MSNLSQRSLRQHMLFVGILGLGLVGGVGGWAATTMLSNAVVGEATVVIDDNVKKVQHLTGGIVSNLPVREGMHVKAGDMLLQLDGTSLKASLGIVNSSLSQLYARRARLQAERAGDSSFSTDDLVKAGLDLEANKALIEGETQLFQTRRSALEGMKKQLAERKGQLAEEIQGDTLQIQATEESLRLIEEEHKAINSLYEQQLVTMQRVNVLKRGRAELEGNRGERIAARAQAEGKINEINLQILQLDEDRSSENAKELTDVEAKIAEAQERRVAVTDQLTRLDLKAPMDGYIYQLSIHTVGGVVNAGEPLMLLAPDTRTLTVEAKIATRNIDQIHIGQTVDIRFSAFDQRTTPEVDGNVTSVSPDAIADQRTGATYYTVRITPSKEGIAKLSGLSLYPGMPAEVFIKVADRTVISYLTKPLTDQMRHTFREE